MNSKTFLTTCEGDKVDVTKVKTLFVEIPLKEILGYNFSEILQKYIPIHNREKFQIAFDYYKYPDGKIEKKIRWETMGTLEKDIKFDLTTEEYYKQVCPLIM